MKKFLLKLLFNKKQREIIWQAMIFSEHTYRRRGDVDGAAVVQTVINETRSAFGVVKDTYTKEEVDYIVAQVIKDTRAEAEKQLRKVFRNGVDSSKKEIEAAYKKGVEDAKAKMTGVDIVVFVDDDNIEKKQEEQKQNSSEGGETEGQETADKGSQESEQDGQTTEEQKDEKE